MALPRPPYAVPPATSSDSAGKTLPPYLRLNLRNKAGAITRAGNASAYPLSVPAALKLQKPPLYA
jgi:hypothetical protein